MGADDKEQKPITTPGSKEVDPADVISSSGKGGKGKKKPEKKPSGPGGKEPSGTKLRLENFGVMETGEFDPDKIKLERIKEFDIPEESLKEAYKDQVTIIARQLEEFSRAGHKLTEEQRQFLILYNQDKTGDKLLGTEAGWSLAHLMIEQEVFLRLADLGRKMELKLRYHAKDEIPDKASLKDLQGTLTKIIEEIDPQLVRVLGTSIVASGLETFVAGNPLMGIIFGAGTPAVAKGVKELIKGLRDGKIKISDCAIDASLLPGGYQEYLKYTASKTNETGVTRFLFRAARAQKGFYETLGVDVRNLDSLHPWEGLDLGEESTPGDLVQNIGTEWMRKRREIWKSIGGPAGNTPAEKAASFLQAQKETIAYFTGQHMMEIAEGRQEAVGDSIAQMEKRISQLTDPAEIAKRTEEKRKELGDTKNQIDTQKSELRKVLDEIKKRRRETAVADQKRPVLNQNKGRINDRVTALKNELDNLRDQRDHTTNRQDILVINEQIRKGEESLAEQERRLSQIEGEINRLDELARDFAVLEVTRQEIEEEMSKLKGEVGVLEGDLGEGLTDEEKKQLGSLRAVVAALKRLKKDEIMGGLAMAATKELTIDDLTDKTTESEDPESYDFGQLKGYLTTMRHLFGRPPEGLSNEEFFEAVVGLLPPRKLAELLAESLGITLPIPANLPITDPSTPKPLEHVFEAIKAGRISQPTMNEALFSVLNYIERRGKRIA